MAATPAAAAVHPDVAGEDGKAISQVEPPHNTAMLKEVMTGEEGAGDDQTEVMVKDVAVEEGKATEEEDAAQGEGEMEVEVDPKTGVSFPTRMDDGKRLATIGLRKKGILGLAIKIYTFGIYVDTAKLREILRSKMGTAPEKPTKELYDTVIDNDIGMAARLVIVFGGLTMSMVRKNMNEGLGASLKKLTGSQKNDELLEKAMGSASDNIKLSSGSIIEISRLPGCIFQTKVKGEVISKVESDLLCRAYFHMYLGEEAIDKEAKERLGGTLLSLF